MIVGSINFSSGDAAGLLGTSVSLAWTMVPFCFLVGYFLEFFEVLNPAGRPKIGVWVKRFVVCSLILLNYGYVAGKAIGLSRYLAGKFKSDIDIEKLASDAQKNLLDMNMNAGTDINKEINKDYGDRALDVELDKAKNMEEMQEILASQLMDRAKIMVQRSLGTVGALLKHTSDVAGYSLTTGLVTVSHLVAKIVYEVILSLCDIMVSFWYIIGPLTIVFTFIPSINPASVWFARLISWALCPLVLNIFISIMGIVGVYTLNATGDGIVKLVSANIVFLLVIGGAPSITSSLVGGGGPSFISSYFALAALSSVKGMKVPKLSK